MPVDIRNKTAFLVIHGVGPHASYQTCDDFARGFVDAFEKQKKTNVKLKHILKHREGPVQSGISLSIPASSGCIDFYEYLWDIYMVHKVLPKEAWDLLLKASKNAKKHYDNLFKDPKVVAQITDMDKVLKSPFFRKTKISRKIEFRPDGYLRLIGGLTIVIVKIIPYIPFIIWILEQLSKIKDLNIPFFSQAYGVISSVIKAISGVFQSHLEKHFAGDLVRYLDLDPRSKHYETRQKIINGAIEEICALMNDYDRIIIAGHSLGSVIAYDVINRIIVQMNAGKIDKKLAAKKIIGLVTFGSPLDKIAFFFRQYIPEEKKMQRKILADRHTFRTSSLLQQNDSIEDPDSFNQLPDVVWLNFWHVKDYISGKLDLYDLSKVPPKNVGTEYKDGTKDGNIRIEGEISFIKAHSCYWGAQKDQGTKKKLGKVITKMQDDIVTEFF